MKILPSNFKDLTVPDVIKIPFTQYDAFTCPPGNGDYSGHADFTSLKIIFLDVDEVLTSSKTLVLTGQVPYPALRGSVPRQVAVGYPEAISKESVGLINKLCNATGALIVLSSSWRLGFSSTQILDMFKMIGLDSIYLLGRTGEIYGREGTTRGVEIQDFLTKLTENENSRETMIRQGYLLPTYSCLDTVIVDSFVIIDDSSDMLPEQIPNLVLVNPVEGFNLSDAIYAGRILTGDEKFGLMNMCTDFKDRFISN
jgi:hypothetical protein